MISIDTKNKKFFYKIFCLWYQCYWRGHLITKIRVTPKTSETEASVVLGHLAHPRPHLLESSKYWIISELSEDRFFIRYSSEVTNLVPVIRPSLNLILSSFFSTRDLMTPLYLSLPRLISSFLISILWKTLSRVLWMPRLSSLPVTGLASSFRTKYSFLLYN